MMLMTSQKIGVLLLVLLFLPTPLLIADDAREVLKSMDAVSNAATAVSSWLELTVILPAGGKRTYGIHRYYLNQGYEEWSKWICDSPPQFRNEMVMRKGASFWHYTPRFPEARLLSAPARRGNWLNSDFAFNDLEPRLSSNWIGRILKEENKEEIISYQLELIPKSENETGYSKLIVWTSSVNFLPTKIDYFVKDKLIKSLLFTNPELIEDIWTVTQYNMINHRNGSESILKIKSIDYKNSLKNISFDERDMGK